MKMCVRELLNIYTPYLANLNLFYIAVNPAKGTAVLFSYYSYIEIGNLKHSGQ